MQRFRFPSVRTLHRLYRALRSLRAAAWLQRLPQLQGAESLLADRSRPLLLRAQPQLHRLQHPNHRVQQYPRPMEWLLLALPVVAPMRSL